MSNLESLGKWFEIFIVKKKKSSQIFNEINLIDSIKNKNRTLWKKLGTI